MDQFADLVLTPIALFSGKPLAVSVALTLIFSALALWLFVLRTAENRFLGPLRHATQKLVPIAAESDPLARKNAAEKIFVAEPALIEPWRRFSAALDVADGELQSFSDPAEVFGLTQLTGHTYPKWSSTLAGVFLTIGLFFTFVGLSAALLQLGGNGHDALSPAQLKNAVQGILAVSSAKFITSIAGILCYIFWSIVARAQGAAQTRAEDELLGALRRISTYVAPEMVLRRQLRLMESQGAGFTAAIQDLSALVATLPGRIGAAQGDVGEKFSQGAAALDRSTENMADQVEAIGARIAATLQGFESRFSALPLAFSAAAEEGARDLNRQMRDNFAETAEIAQKSAQAEAAQISARFEALSASLAAAALAMSSAAENSRETVARGAEKMVVSGEQATTRLNGEISLLAQSVASLAARLDQAERALARHNQHLEDSGEIVAGASKNLALAAGAMESAAAPLTTATLTFRDAMGQLTFAAQRIETLSQSGETIAGHIAQFGTQMTGALAAFDALPEKIRRSETAFGGDILRSSEALNAAALQMSANFSGHQQAMAAMIAGFEQKIAQVPATLGAAAEQSGREIGEKIHGALDSVAAVAQKASASGADLFVARIDEISRALASAADRLLQASDASGASLAENRKTLEAGAEQSAQIFAAAAQNSSDVMSHVVERFADSARSLSLKLAETALGLDAQNTRLEQAGATLGAASTALAEAAGAVASATPPLAAAGVSLERALGDFAETGDRIFSVAEMARDTATNFGKTAGEASQSLKTQSENFGALQGLMTATLDQLNGGVRGLAQNIAEAVEAYDNEIARSIGSLEAALIDMGDILDDRAAKKAGEF